MKIENTPIAEKVMVIIECKLIKIGCEYWRFTNRADAPDGRMFVAKSERDLWNLWERAKVNYNLRFLFYD